MYVIKKFAFAVVVAIILFLSNIAHALEIPLSYDFGEVPVGSSSTALISISTSSDEVYFNVSPKLGYSEHYQILNTVPVGGIPLPPGGTVVIEIKFTPTNAQAVFDTLHIDASNPFFDTISEDVELIGNQTEISINNIIAFFDTSVASGSITGNGKVKTNDDSPVSLQRDIQTGKKNKSADNRLKAFRNMLEGAGQLIADGEMADACDQLESVYGKCDGNDTPPDFVDGYSSQKLAEMIKTFRGNLGCY